MIFRFTASFLILLFMHCAQAQTLDGIWTGLLTQEGKTDTFIYSIDIEELSGKIFGTATSGKPDNPVQAKFEIGGVRDGNKITLQEVSQIEPPDARWCLKHVRLELKGESGRQKAAPPAG